MGVACDSRDVDVAVAVHGDPFAAVLLAPQLGIKAVEEPITIDQWQAECAAGELTETFACGTAAVITPVGQVKSETANWTIADGEPGPVTKRLREELVAIQYGHRPDPFNWIHKVC